MFRTVRRVEFRDTDAAGIVHFSAFFPMMESVEHEFLRSLGIAVMPHASRPCDGGAPVGDGSESCAGKGHSNDVPPAWEASRDELWVTWPRVSASCDYQAAAHFEDLLEIELRVEKVGNSSVSYRFQFRRGETEVANGALIAVCCKLDAGKLAKVAIPDGLREKLAG